MKKIILVVALLSFSVICLNAGQMKIHLQNGYTTSFSVSEIDNITFGEGEGRGAVTDIDGNVYQTIVIGDQEWMMENLKVTRYRNGDLIPTGYDNTGWANLSSAAYCVYDNEPSNADTYGNIYNWYAVNDGRGLAPEGWHIPSDDEWKELEMYLGMTQEQADSTGYRGTNEGSKLAGEADLWSIHMSLVNNPEFGTSGFTGLPGGTRSGDNGLFAGMGMTARFTSSVYEGGFSCWGRGLGVLQSGVVRDCFSKKDGYSVRCVRSVNAGDMNIHLQDGTTASFDISEIDNITFEEGGAGTVTDVDGNVYQTVVIGDQEWMMENLKVKHYMNGDPIPNVTDSTDWINANSGAYCVYENEPSNADTYGNLYNWYAVNDSRGLAPEGWHVPTDEEWQILVDYLGGTFVAGGKMKTTGTIEASGLWHEPNTGATNESGFTALPGGWRSSGSFDSIGYYTVFWSSTEKSEYPDYAYRRTLHYDCSFVSRYANDKNSGYSVRCIKSVE